jgi:hypothetical protein
VKAKHLCRQRLHAFDPAPRKPRRRLHKQPAIAFFERKLDDALSNAKTTQVTKR